MMRLLIGVVVGLSVGCSGAGGTSSVPRAVADGWSAKWCQASPGNTKEQLIPRLRAARNIAWARRVADGHKITIGRLRLGPIDVLQMPGELFIEARRSERRNAGLVNFQCHEAQRWCARDYQIEQFEDAFRACTAMRVRVPASEHLAAGDMDFKHPGQVKLIEISLAVPAEVDLVAHEVVQVEEDTRRCFFAQSVEELRFIHVGVGHVDINSAVLEKYRNVQTRNDSGDFRHQLAKRGRVERHRQADAGVDSGIRAAIDPEGGEVLAVPKWPIVRGGVGHPLQMLDV